MPNYLRLTDKETGKSFEGEDLILVDERMCKDLGVPVDDKNFYKGWVDWWVLYMSDDWKAVRKTEKETGFDPEYYKQRKIIINWLAKHYVLNSYAMMGR